MRKIVLAIMMSVSLCLLLAGCFGSAKETTVNNNLNSSPGEDSPADIFANDPSQIGMGMFSYGIVAPNDDQQVYEYTGEEVHIPFKVTGLDEEVSSDFGLLVFVDGLAQPYRIQANPAEPSAEQLMHKFSLKYEETEEFDIVFTPVSGQKGDKVGVVFATILQPDYKPENENKPNYGIYHSLSATLSQEIEFQADLSGDKKLQPYKDAVTEDIPEEIKNQAETVLTDGSSDYLDETTVNELLPEDPDQNLITATNGKAKLKFRIYGGLETTYRTTIFVNHTPVQVKGADYIETTLQKGKMNTVEIELDTSAYDKLNTIYAISVVSGKDYLTNNNSPLKTKSLLLYN